ncbi:MAG TPA: histidine phosphatase family protein, partial [Phenylobacterium sp.]
MPRLYLIRHGKPATVWGQGADEDPGLDEAGRAQAERARDALLAMAPEHRP